ncbi:MAG: hypothetical protein HYY76_10280 [Acidobacteria bacterium]|nr:hypothetical protein [Acidobacteriota bacterium]
MRRAVEALLAHAQTAEAFLDGSVGAVAAAVLTDAPGALAGRRIGAYSLLALLGAGGMGEVYRARDTKLGRDVAMKVLPASVAHDPSRRARFEREARLLATLNHPHIAAIHSLEESDGRPRSRRDDGRCRRGAVRTRSGAGTDGSYSTSSRRERSWQFPFSSARAFVPKARAQCSRASTSVRGSSVRVRTTCLPTASDS